jgi:hypothetical protein
MPRSSVPSGAAGNNAGQRDAVLAWVKAGKDRSMYWRSYTQTRLDETFRAGPVWMGSDTTSWRLLLITRPENPIDSAGSDLRNVNIFWQESRRLHHELPASQSELDPRKSSLAGTKFSRLTI